MALDTNAAFEAKNRTILATLATQMALTKYGAKSGLLFDESDTDDITSDFDFMIDQFGLERLKNNLPEDTLKQASITVSTDEYVGNVTIPLRKLATKHGGNYVQQAKMMSRALPRFVDAKVAALLKSTGEAFTKNSFDGVPYFSKLHKSFSGNPVQSNLDDSGGGNGYWMLFDTSLLPPVFVQYLQRPHVDEFGPDDPVSKRERKVKWNMFVDIGFAMGLWYFGYASNLPLTEANLEAARAAMTAIKTDAKTDGEDQELGIEPNLLVVGRANHLVAKKLLNQVQLASSESNVMVGAYDLLSFSRLP